MLTTKVPPLAEYFKDITDPRIDRLKKYQLVDIIVITMLAILSGAEGWEDIEYFCRAKEQWLKQFLLLENGIPGHDVYRRVFVRLDSKQVEFCFMAWINALKPIVSKEIIAIDGKSIRGTFSTYKSLRAVHLVSAWASERRLTLGQVKVNEKSNEITAIPELLELIAIKGCIVTIDAMGCQYEIANKIIESEADFVFSLKGNQSGLHNDVKEYFADHDFEASAQKPIQCHKTFDVDHGRIETRYHAISSDTTWLKERHPQWSSIQSIGVIKSVREINNKVSTEHRYFVSSLPADAQLFAKAVRAHWSIENSCHYVLDVVFREDASRITAGNAVENLAWMRKFALALAGMDTTPGRSTKKKLKLMAWSHEYLQDLLFGTALNDIELPSTIVKKKTVEF